MKFSKLTRQREIGVRAVRYRTGSQDADLSDPQYDSRNVREGSTFFAIRGESLDGHAFISHAVALGAATIVCEDEYHNDNVNVIVVENSRKALAIISEAFFGSPSTKLRLIGVTGTNGKTTTTNIIRQLLTAHGEKTGLIGTLGVWIGDEHIATEFTTPISRDISEMLSVMVEHGITTCIMEVSSHAVTLDRITALDFDIAVFTNLTQDHLDFHNTMEEYAETKQRFFSMLNETALAVTNADDAYGSFMVEHTRANAHSYGRRDTESDFGISDITASNIKVTLRGTSFDIRKRYSDELASVAAPLVGDFNVENLLAAISALYFGVEGCSLEHLAALSKEINPVRGRFEQVMLPNDALVIIDYAHTPDALENVLETIHKLRTDGKLITLFGCGGDRDKTKRPLMGAVAQDLSDVVIVTSDNPRTEDPESIIRDVLSGISDEAITIIDRREAIQEALRRAEPNDIILIAGKGHEDYQILGKEKVHFDDKEIVMEWSMSNPQ